MTQLRPPLDGGYPAVRFSWETVPVFFHADNFTGAEPLPVVRARPSARFPPGGSTLFYSTLLYFTLLYVDTEHP